MNAIFLGPPGAGKGTQAKLLRQDHGVVVIATGDLLRKAVRERTPMGLKAQAVMEAGKLVPDDVIFGIVQEHLDRLDGASVLFDGFPRNIAQADRLFEMLEDLGRSLDAVFLFEIDEETVVRRISGRRVCSTCSESFHVDFDPPPPGPVCERGLCEIIQREDDREEVVRDRLAIFHEQTEPLVAYYEETGILHRIDAARGPAEVAAHIRTVLFEPA